MEVEDIYKNISNLIFKIKKTLLKLINECNKSIFTIKKNPSILDNIYNICIGETDIKGKIYSTDERKIKLINYILTTIENDGKYYINFFNEIDIFFNNLLLNKVNKNNEDIYNIIHKCWFTKVNDVKISILNLENLHNKLLSDYDTCNLNSFLNNLVKNYKFKNVEEVKEEIKEEVKEEVKELEEVKEEVKEPEEVKEEVKEPEEVKEEVKEPVKKKMQKKKKFEFNSDTEDDLTLGKYLNDKKNYMPRNKNNIYISSDSN